MFFDKHGGEIDKMDRIKNERVGKYLCACHRSKITNHCKHNMTGFRGFCSSPSTCKYKVHTDSNTCPICLRQVKRDPLIDKSGQSWHGACLRELLVNLDIFDIGRLSK